MTCMLRGVCAVALLGLVAPAFGELVDNPAYTAWAKYKPGTTVTMEQKMEMARPADAPADSPMPGTMNSEMTQTLEKLTPEAATVSMEMKMDIPGMPGGGRKMEQSIPAKVEKGRENLPPQMERSGHPVEVKDTKIGTDTVEVDGKKIATSTVEMTVVDTQTKAEQHVKIWSSPTVPGGRVKMTMDGTAGPGGPQMTMASQLKSFKVVE